MSIASNLAALARILTSTASGIVNGKAPAAGDSSTALINSAWFKGEVATEGAQGTAKVATQAQTNSGTDDTTIVTPKKLRAGFAASLTGNGGYVALPSWLGGFIIQWGYYSLAANVYWAQVTLPIAWPSGYMQGVASDSGASCYPMAISSYSNTQIQVWVTQSKGATSSGVNWIAIGK